MLKSNKGEIMSKISLGVFFFAAILKGTLEAKASSLGDCPELAGTYLCDQYSPYGENLVISQEFKSGALVYNFSGEEHIADGQNRMQGTNEENKAIVSYTCEGGTLVQSASWWLAPTRAQLRIFSNNKNPHFDLSIKAADLRAGKKTSTPNLNESCTRK
jgi:hypothetical protein